MWGNFFILQCLDNEYLFTEKGDTLKEELERDSPFYQYEYNNYFEMEEMKSDFEAEDSLDLWEYRYTEAKRYANWGDDKYARYLYEIWV